MLSQPMCVLQAAFKRPAASEVTSAGSSEVNVDWDTVKAEDKTLVHQVGPEAWTEVAVAGFVLNCHRLSHQAISG